MCIRDRITEGTFDITYGSIDKRFWNFDTKMTSLPDENLAKKSIALITVSYTHLDVYKRQPQHQKWKFEN